MDMNQILNDLPKVRVYCVLYYYGLHIIYVHTRGKKNDVATPIIVVGQLTRKSVIRRMPNFDLTVSHFIHNFN